MSLLRSSTLLHRLPTALPVSSLLAARFNSTNNPRDMAKKATEKLGEGFGEKTGDMLKEKMNEAGEMLERGKEKVKGMGQEVANAAKERTHEAGDALGQAQQKAMEMGQRAREEIANAADSFRPEEPGQAAATLAQQAKDAYRTTVETAKQGLGKIFGGEIAPLKTGEMEGYVKDKASQAGEKMEEGARQMGWDPKAIREKTGTTVQDTINKPTSETDREAIDKARKM